MPYFFDTNISIGYFFSWDPWHELTLEAFSKGQEMHWSNTVEIESYKKHKIILKKIKKFLLNINQKIKSTTSDILSKENILNMVKSSFKNDKDISKYVKGIHEIWSINDLNPNKEDKSKIINILYNTFLRFDSRVLFRRKKFKKFVKLHRVRVSYPDIVSKLHENAKNLNVECHYPDDTIVADAHHVSFNISDSLDFVTSDKNICKYAEGVTNLNSLIYLKDL